MLDGLETAYDFKSDNKLGGPNTLFRQQPFVGMHYIFNRARHVCA